MKNRYRGQEDFDRGRAARTGVLIVNLGTPSAPSTKAVRRFLAEFLNDPRVIELPSPLRRALLHGVVLRLRPQRSARAYRKIWRDDGSPLLVYSRALERRLRDTLAERLSGPVTVALAMRYGEPGIAETLHDLMAAGIERLLVLPLYPQYSAATTGSAFDALARELSRLRRVPALRFVNHYHDDPDYIAAVAATLRDRLTSSERVLFSFHGMPEATRAAGDPYYHQCLTTARLVAHALDLAPACWAVAFQSRFGRRAWLSPASDAVLTAWAGDGVKAVTVICPGFAVDCLETLEEVNIRYRHAFLDAGGDRFEYVPTLNDGPGHVHALGELIVRELAHWPETRADDLSPVVAEEAGACEPGVRR